MKYALAILSISIMLISCSQEEEIPTLEVGQDFTDSNVRVVSIDTFKVELSTYKFDSINTSSSNRILLGQYTDAIFGKTRAESYMELTTSIYSIPDDAELDSIALILNYDQYFYNDTTQVSTINVHLLTDELRPDDDVFYNTSSVPYEENPIASRSYFPEPIDEDSLHISIPIAVGELVFDKIKENDINDNDELRNEFKGFALIPGDNDDSSVIGFSTDITNTYLRFFYRVPGEFEDDERTFDLSIITNQNIPPFFNKIESNTEGTFFDTLTDQEINLASEDANNRSYIQSGVGMVTRIQFPTIKKIFEIPGTGTVLDATLLIKPPPQEFSEILPIRDSLAVYRVDQNNLLNNQLFNGEGAVFARVNEDDKEFNEIVYEVPVGPYIENELTESPEIDDALILLPINFNNTVDRTVLEGEGSTDFEVKLVITYAIYDE
ncbi:DUF4270 family protein [Aquimarina sp. 2201CG5-10]|uniref:DUF4270 family protein n=1 Tax=Aquimarina callyspongiae TaxID=3098150 RepID=UPI002AB4280C|nr:DUF4270 family protein [Aquimarina sp. 2201CG5-10]MDY8136139.1 DUF4270 family protein [Aquimarina sp. 2201CG5-10]